MESYAEGFCIVLSKSKIMQNVISEMLEGEGFYSLISGNFKDITYFVSVEGVPDYLFIDIDSFEGVAVIYDQLRNIRETLPHTTVVLLSSDFETDEFGTHRIMLGDVSVRLPLTYSNLQLALLQGPMNNEIWNRHRTEMEREDNNEHREIEKVRLVRVRAH